MLFREKKGSGQRAVTEPVVIFYLAFSRSSILLELSRTLRT